MDFWTFRRLACSSVTDPSWTLTLTATGTGAGVATMRVNLSSASSATLNANGHFYTDAAGTLGESQSRSLASGWNTLYIKVTSGAATLAFADSSLVTMWGSLRHLQIWDTRRRQMPRHGKEHSLTYRRILRGSMFTAMALYLERFQQRARR